MNRNWIVIAAAVLLLMARLIEVPRDLAQQSIDQQMDTEFANGTRFDGDPLDACDDPCRIVENYGGRVVVFRFAARSLLARKTGGIIIDGVCASACVGLADAARPAVCITRRAEFYLHKSNLETDPRHSPDIAEWVASRGGYPSNASGDLLAMLWPETTKFWPQCQETIVPSQSRNRRKTT